jgi:hypothetical protein
MRWTVLSILMAILLSVVGWIISGYAFDIFAKVVFWNVVMLYFTVESAHLIHIARERGGG